MTPAEPHEGPAVLLDFGRGSREQTQGGPGRKDNVHPIRKAAETRPRG